jgi:hypothetical protein
MLYTGELINYNTLYTYGSNNRRSIDQLVWIFSYNAVSAIYTFGRLNKICPSYFVNNFTSKLKPLELSRIIIQNTI